MFWGVILPTLLFRPFYVLPNDGMIQKISGKMQMRIMELIDESFTDRQE